MGDFDDQERKLFLKALELEAPSARDSFLKKECRGDSKLYDRVVGLLLSYGQAGGFLQSDQAGNHVPNVSSREERGSAGAVTEGPGTVIGRYKLLQKIGEGGFGIVYLAEQREPIRRKVALKIIKLGMDTKQVVARFESERQALAMMDHPNIAKVLDGGATAAGRPYFVMEWVRGMPVTEFCDEHRLNIAARLRLFVAISRALHHAHQKGVIHRDIKPSNILVSSQDDMHRPKVIDFGIAKATQQELTEKTIFTHTHEFMGTPAYMSPEQAQFSGFDIDTRTDIYSLGVLLYELLTGRTPFKTSELLAGGYDSLRRIIREKEPVRPSVRVASLGREALLVTARDRAESPGYLSARLAGDLDWIVLKALEKDRSRRYESANALAADVENYLEDRPVEAGAPGWRYRITKFARRHRVVLAAYSGVAVILIAGTAFSSIMAYRAMHAERQTRRLLEQEWAEHRMAQQSEIAAVEAQRRAHDEASVSEAVNRFLNEDLLGPMDSVHEPERDLKLRTLLDRASQKVDGRFPRQPIVEATIRHTLAQAYLNLGEYVVAESHAARSRDLRRDILSPQDPSLLRARLTLAASIVMQGRYREIVGNLEDLHEYLLTSLGMRHELTMEAAYWLAKTYGQIFRLAEGEGLMVTYMPLAQEVLAPEHWLRPALLNERGFFHVAFRRMDEAEIFYRTWLDRYRRQFGSEHPYSMMLMHHLATALIYQNKLEECKEVYLETLRLKEKVLGPEHPSRVKTLAEFAWYYRYSGHPDEGERMLEEAFGMATRAMGPDHPETRKISDWLCLSYRRTGKMEKLRDYLQEVLSFDAENQHALEHLTAFLDRDRLITLMPDGQQSPAIWKYTVQKPSVAWMQPDFDDAGWNEGAAPFGNTETPPTRTWWDGSVIWLRRAFELPDGASGRLVLQVAQDDYSEVYLNGRVALIRQTWTARNRAFHYALHDAVSGLKRGRNIVAVRCDNAGKEGLIDLGIFLEPVGDADPHPVAPIP